MTLNKSLKGVKTDLEKLEESLQLCKRELIEDIEKVEKKSEGTLHGHYYSRWAHIMKRQLKEEGSQINPVFNDPATFIALSWLKDNVEDVYDAEEVIPKLKKLNEENFLVAHFVSKLYLEDEITQNLFIFYYQLSKF